MAAEPSCSKYESKDKWPCTNLSHRGSQRGANKGKSGMKDKRSLFGDHDFHRTAPLQFLNEVSVWIISIRRLALKIGSTARVRRLVPNTSQASHKFSTALSRWRFSSPLQGWRLRLVSRQSTTLLFIYDDTNST